MTISLVACGGSTTSDGVASVDDVEGTPAAGSTDAGGTDARDAGGGSGEPRSQAEVEDAFAAWDTCMAEQGVAMPYYDEPQGNGIDAAQSTEPLDEEFDEEAYAAAAEKCDKLIPDQAYDPLAGLDQEQQALLSDYLLDFEKCMSKNGYNFPFSKVLSDGMNDEFQAEMQAETDRIEALPPDERAAMDTAENTCDEQVALPPELEDFMSDPEAGEQ